MPDSAPHRREFLKGRGLSGAAAHTPLPNGSKFIASLGNVGVVGPSSNDTLRLTARAMACDFSVIMNAGEHRAIWQTSAALDFVGELEQQLSVYRDDSEVSRLNGQAAIHPVLLERNLFQLLSLANQLSRATLGAFDITTGPLIRLWRLCRDEGRLPDDGELRRMQLLVGMTQVLLHESDHSIQFQRPGVSIDLGAIGKGHALDRVQERITSLGHHDVLLHGGRSSVLAAGNHHGQHGWPVGLGNPLLTNRRLGTIVLRDQALATSGSNIQHFRIGGRRYGHILDPRTGWPVEGRLSVTAVAPSAAIADALSTAFYVMDMDEVQRYCRDHADVGAIIIPLPEADRRVVPRVFGIDPRQLYWDAGQVRV